MKATSDYLNQPLCDHADVVQLRAGGDRTICDLPDDYDPYVELEEWRQRADRQWQIFRDVVLVAILFLVLGFITVSLWNGAYRLGERPHAAISETGFEGGN